MIVKKTIVLGVQKFFDSADNVCDNNNIIRLSTSPRLQSPELKQWRAGLSLPMSWGGKLK